MLNSILEKGEISLKSKIRLKNSCLRTAEQFCIISFE